jgi:hypothetical protein
MVDAMTHLLRAVAILAALILVAAAEAPEKPATLTGVISVQYRDFRLGDGPVIHAPSFTIAVQPVPEGGRSIYGLIIRQADIGTLTRLAKSKATTKLSGHMMDVNHHQFLVLETIEGPP